MPASDEYYPGMQYTIRSIPKKVDQALRRKAKEEGRSLNDIVVEALSIVTGVVEPAKPIKYSDMSDIAGTWVEDPEFDKIIEEQDQIDPEMWR
jgi:hypothetical protein